MGSGLKRLALLITFILLNACIETKVLPVVDPLNRLSAVAVGSPNFSLPIGATLAWRNDVIWLRGKNLPEEYGKTNGDIYSSVIEQQLMAQGYRFTLNVQQADYVLIAAAVMGESEKGDAFQDLAKLHPSLEEFSEGLEKGTLMLAVSRPGSPLILWRAAIQAYIAEGLEMSERMARLNAVVRSLLDTLPMGSAS